jgi:membrane-associated phospholipid phosphatase
MSFARNLWGGPLDRVIAVAGQAGTGGIVWVAAEAALNRRRGGSARPSAGVTGAVYASYVSSMVLARLIRRPRPCDGNGFSLITCPTGPSLPSDQTAAGFAAAYAISTQHPQARTGLYAAATVIALARVYCGVHYPSDVVSGAGFGLATAITLDRSGRRRRAAVDGAQRR